MIEKIIIRYITIISILIICIIFISLCSCTTTKYVEVPIEKTHIEYKTIHELDSVYMRDSIYIHQKNDTVFSEKWHTKYVTKIKTDTVNVIDSIPKPYYITKEIKVEKELHWYQKILIWIGIITLIAFITMIIIKIIKTK